VLRRRVRELEAQNAALETSRRRLQSLFENAPDAYYLCDLEGRFVDGNAAAERATGYAREALIGKQFLEVPLLSSPDLERAAALLAKSAAGELTGPDEFRLHRKDGTTLAVEIRTHPVTIEGQQLVLGIARDISVRKDMETALRENEERLRDLFENANDLIQSVRPDATFEFVNRAWRNRLGYGEDEVNRLTLWDIVHPESASYCRTVFDDVLAGQVVGRIEAVFVAKGGERIPVEGHVSCRFDGDRPVATRGIFRDVSERKLFEERLALMARRDPLTGVFNRYALEELLRLEAERSSRYEHPVGFLLIDVNRFKEINDRFGHLMGDKVLKAVAKVIQDQVRGSDVIVRYGGDEFLVILLETDGETELVKRRILSKIDQWNESDPLVDFPVTLAIGSIHWDPGSDKSLEEVLAQADHLMYEDKRGQDG